MLGPHISLKHTPLNDEFWYHDWQPSYSPCSANQVSAQAQAQAPAEKTRRSRPPGSLGREASATSSTPARWRHQTRRRRPSAELAGEALPLVVWIHGGG